MRSKRVKLEPLGDQAVLAAFADEPSAFQFAEAVRQANFPWTVDVVPAYVSVAVFFDPGAINSQGAADALGRLRLAKSAARPRLHEIPCCYELSPDLGKVAKFTGLAAEEVIRLHTSVEYTVYAIGFCPGFPYLGYLPAPLSGVPRLEKPRLQVEAGSVGVAGRQTGIYPLPRPGGWHLIGRTPFELVDVEQEYFPIQPGDRLRFSRIDEVEFERLMGRRLPAA